ncbi:uncharacterized protein [Atheta coriaria]|uniref:uncharacterized protein isoform X8 n=1 Tax=Dalotia coriaria TaxID=877792 RepID=UPI0031F3B38E
MYLFPPRKFSYSCGESTPGEYVPRRNNSRRNTVYKWCGVPHCGNTSKKTPNKLFVFVPQKKSIRDKWLELAKRDSFVIMATTHLYFCEDHFDLPNDMENYTEYRVMGSVSQVRMRAGCMPTKFECQPDRRRRAGNERTRPLVVKRQRLEAIADCEREIEQARSAQSISNAEVQPGPSSGDSKGDVLNVQVNVSVGNTIENNDYYQHGTLNPCDSRYTETDRVSRNSCIKKECEDMSTEDLSESEDNEHVNIKTEPNVNCYEDYIINYGIKEDIDPEDQKFNRDVDIKSETMEEYEDETATNFCRPELQSIVQNSENYHEST